MKPVYIKGTASLSPQKTFLSNRLPDEIIISENNLLRCVEPSYSEYLNPVMARRMGRIIKMGVATAMECLKDAKVEMPGAIITGTALGCLGDTEKFLTSIIMDKEQFLTPTHFIQSIQNTVSAQIALQLKCMNHNFTFVHKGFSFESALIDSMMLLQENEADNVLVGGLDEMTEKNFHIYNRLGIWKKEVVPSNEMLQHKTPGTIGGEGSCFFVLNNTRNKNDYAVLNAVKTIYDPLNGAAIEKEIANILTNNSITPKDISLVLYGYNGDPANDAVFDEIRNGLPEQITAGYFKHLCGEYQTSGAFALWLAATILKNNRIPDSVILNNANTIKEPKYILILNRYENNFSIMLASAL